MVPDLRNEFFIGRDAFLKTLRQKFQVNNSARYQSRIALFRMGGIGKTQTALLNSFTALEPQPPTAEYIGSQPSLKSPCWMDTERSQS